MLVWRTVKLVKIDTILIVQKKMYNLLVHLLSYTELSSLYCSCVFFQYIEFVLFYIIICALMYALIGDQ